MERSIIGFHQDDEGHWVAELDCGHDQHVRHSPPWQERPWVVTEEGRRRRLGTPLPCVLCDRRELPGGFAPYKRTATFDQDSLPAGLRSQHTLKPGVWAAIHVLEGTLRYRVHEPAPAEELLSAGDTAFIAPEVAHEVAPQGPVRLYIEFYKRAGEPPP